MSKRLFSMELCRLQQEIELIQNQLDSLEKRKESMMMIQCGMDLDKVERLDNLVVELKRLIWERYDRAIEEKIELEKLMLEITDPRMRIILELRLEKGKTWSEIAEMVGGNNTAAGVRKTFSRYIHHKMKE